MAGPGLSGERAASDAQTPDAVARDEAAPDAPTREHDEAMGLALAEARAALATQDVPVGAVVLDASGAVVGRGRNRREADGDPVAHAEILAIREAAAALGQWRLEGCTLVVTLEPCTMCAGAMVLARLPHLVFGAYDPKAGAAGSVTDVVRDPRLNHAVDVVGGVRAQECGEELRAFFRARRRARPPAAAPVTPAS
ncbi:tRNA adenosine(34) deaminase TadA [Litorihabitans aurantiacus]|uniref:tRNA-specific adenosine deaminase n=1 Tax=Litorihabitans aurantiacus TaxID=1930061 RepID=A0AA37UJ28_9MICO|nr:tRNA adenosine(34) deaminase TadA [Litorihabitans aurantiacus]GMA30085.1 tRNA-specific adenosine deaminase [Litorihabitans aurantiacus]